VDKYTVKFDIRARNQLASVARYLAGAADPNRASSFVRDLTNEAKSLKIFPYRGQSKDHIYPGLHIIGYKRRATIAYLIDDTDKTVSIAGIFYGGQDWESELLALLPQQAVSTDKSSTSAT